MQESTPVPVAQQQPVRRLQDALTRRLAGLRLRLLALVLIPGLMALLYLGIFDHRFDRQAEEQISEHLRLSLHVAQIEQSQALARTEQFLAMLIALARATNEPHFANCSKILAAASGNLSQLQNYGFLDRDGKILCAFVQPQDAAGFGGREFIREALASGRLSVSGYQIGPVTGLPQIGFALPVRETDGSVRHLAFATVHLDVFQRARDAAGLEDEYDMLVADAGGNLVFSHPPRPALLGKPIAQTLASASVSPSKVYTRRDFDGQMRLAASSTIMLGRESMTLSVGLPVELIAQRAQQLRREALLVIALICLVAALVTWFAVDIMLLRKIAGMRSAAGRWAQGDLQARTGIAAGSGELRRLAADLDSMAAELLALTQRHRLILQAAGEGIYGLDTEGVLHFLNPATASLLGFSEQALQGRRMADTAGPYTEAAAQSASPDLPLQLEPGEVRRHSPVYFRRADGRILRADLTRAPLYEAGRQVGVVDVFEDRTEAHRAAQALAASEARLRAIFDAAPDAILIVDHHGRVVLANEEAVKLSGYAPSSLCGLAAEALVPLEMRADYLLKRLLAREDNPVVPLRAESAMRRADGGRVEIELGLAAFRTDEGRYVVLLARDITVRKRAQAELMELTETLERRVQLRTAAIERAYRDLEAFSYTVAHDLRSPLRGISGYLQLMLKHDADRLSGTGRELFDRVLQSVNRMDQMIEDILRYSRSGTGRVETTEVDMGALAREVLSELAEQSAGIRVELCDLPRVRGDRTMLKQVWVNLIGNAIKFSAVREEPRVEIGCKHDEECVFHVADNGVGFEMAHADKLFGMFERLHPGEQFKGTGVGLAIVRRLIERQGGQVWAKAEPGRGATFYFTLGECLDDADGGP